MPASHHPRGRLREIEVGRADHLHTGDVDELAVEPGVDRLSATSIAMSNSQPDGVCAQCGSVGLSGLGSSNGRLAVDADAAKPQRAGVAPDSWSSTSRSVTGIMPPENTSRDMTDTTSIGMICSLDRASADSARPRMAEATPLNGRAGAFATARTGGWAVPVVAAPALLSMQSLAEVQRSLLRLAAGVVVTP